MSLTSIIVMTYNEVDSLAKTVHEMSSYLESCNLPHEIIIVDDGSTDGSGEVADQLARSIPDVRVIYHGANLGLGGVYRTGLSDARGEFITFFPADGQFPPTIISQFSALTDNADLVLGYLPQSRRAALAQALSLGERLLYRLLFGPLPKFQGVFLARRSMVEELELRSRGRGWAIVLELIIRAARRGYRVASTPTEMRERVSGRSKVNNLKTIWANLLQAIMLRQFL